MPPPPPPIRDVVVRRILRLLDTDSARKTRLASAGWRRCFDFQWPGGEWKYLCTLIDVAKYARVHTLIIYNCPNVTDVASLGAVHTLTLYNCPGVTDVSSLATLHTLRLYRCPNVPPAQIAALRSHGVTVTVYK